MNSRVVLLQGYVALYSSYTMINNNKVPAPKEHTVLKAGDGALRYRTNIEWRMVSAVGRRHGTSGFRTEYVFVYVFMHGWIIACAQLVDGSLMMFLRVYCLTVRNIKFDLQLRQLWLSSYWTEWEGNSLWARVACNFYCLTHCPLISVGVLH